MARSVREIVRGATGPVLRGWDRIPMRVQGRITVALPLVAVAISACLALTGNLQRVDIETDIQRKFEMSGALGQLTTLMVNAETGMRGYLLTGQSEFLEPFDQASIAQPGAISRLTALAAAEPGEKPRIDKLQRIAHLRTLTDQQLTDLSRQRGYPDAGRGAADPQLRQDLVEGKSLMDQIRVEVDVMQGEERALLDDRIDEINAIRVRDYLSVALALLAAVVTRFVAWYLFRNGILRRVERLTDDVRGLRNGQPTSSPAPRKKDTLGELEREVHLLGS